MSGIVGSRFNIRGSGLVGSMGSDGQVFTSAGAGERHIFEAAAAGGISHDGSTADGVLTFKDSDEATVEANLTFNGSVLAAAGNITATGTVEPAGDTAASDNAAIGYTSAEGLILTGQGSTNDVTIKNDADADVITIATGATNVDIVGDVTAGTVNADGDTAAGDNSAMGYTASEGLILTGQGSTNDVTIKNDADTTVLEVATGGVDVEVSGGNLIMGTAGKGIDFGATGDFSGGTAESEVLADYEEGTFAGTMVGATSAGTTTYTNQAGYYIKVGKLVTVHGGLGWDAMTGTGQLKLGNLPFAVTSQDSAYGGSSIGLTDLTMSSTYTAITIVPQPSGSYALLWEYKSNGRNNLAVDTSSFISIGMHYESPDAGS
jgi:hypothetical protein